MFGRKKKEPEPSLNIKDICGQTGHVYRDFPFYLRYCIDGQNNYIEIVEPYACCVCGDIKREVLEKITYQDSKSAQEGLKKLQDQYKDVLKPMAVVNDMIYDYIYLKDKPKDDKEDENIPSITIGPPRTLMN